LPPSSERLRRGGWRWPAQKFFLQPMHFADFGQFDEQVLKVTHTEHNLSAETLEKVRSKFNGHMSQEGAVFQMPIRVDILKKTVP